MKSDHSSVLLPFAMHTFPGREVEIFTFLFLVDFVIYIIFVYITDVGHKLDNYTFVHLAFYHLWCCNDRIGERKAEKV